MDPPPAAIRITRLSKRIYSPGSLEKRTSFAAEAPPTNSSSPYADAATYLDQRGRGFSREAGERAIHLCAESSVEGWVSGACRCLAGDAAVARRPKKSAACTNQPTP